MSKLTINHEKDNTLFFSVNVQGVEEDDIVVRFSICLPNMDLVFKCENKKDDQWKVVIPKLPFVEPDDYRCTIEVVANEYYFTAMEGELKIVTTPKVKATKISTDESKAADDEADTTPSVSVSAITVEGIVSEPDEQVEETINEEEVEIPLDARKDNETRVSSVLKELGLTHTPAAPAGRSLKTFLKR